MGEWLRTLLDRRSNGTGQRINGGRITSIYHWIICMCVLCGFYRVSHSSIWKRLCLTEHSVAWCYITRMVSLNPFGGCVAMYEWKTTKDTFVVGVAFKHSVDVMRRENAEQFAQIVDNRFAIYNNQANTHSACIRYMSFWYGYGGVFLTRFNMCSSVCITIFIFKRK